MKHSFLHILTVLIVFLSQTSFAWDTLVSCDNGRFIIEKQCYSGPSQYGSPQCYTSRTQMVIRNSNVQKLFVVTNAYGYYQHPGQTFGFPEMVVELDYAGQWGYSGFFNYQLFIPYRDSSINISYYINFLENNNISVKAYANASSPYNIIRQGELITHQYNNCWIK
jgi:hypothetical protein